MGECVYANGKKRYVSAKTKPEVRQKLRKLLEDRDVGIAHNSEGLTVEKYMDRWLEFLGTGLGEGHTSPMRPSSGCTSSDARKSHHKAKYMTGLTGC
jgi:hypothetical protein